MANAPPIPRCVLIFASEDVGLAENLVAGLRSLGVEVWWSQDISQGSWERTVREKIETCAALIPLVTRATRDKPIFTDEWRYAVSLDRAIFPFVMDAKSIPLGLGGYSHTDAKGWDGTPAHSCIHQLRKKLLSHFVMPHIARALSAVVGNKSLLLPSFIYSLSSFETQLDPIDGLELMKSLAPPACLISAYDASEYLQTTQRKFRSALKALKSTPSIVVLDSGHYEAARKDDYQSKTNKTGWCADRFWEVANEIEADLVFSYDEPQPEGTVATVLSRIFKKYIADWHKTGLDSNVLCPIVHVPAKSRNPAEDAAEIVAKVAKEIGPTIIAIPERELGDGLMVRMRAVKKIRTALNDLDTYQPLHILGTGNPISIAALSACGADSFDGLEWCRTAANYETHNLLHFQQFDLLKDAFAGRVTNVAARSIIALDGAPFELRAASYNYDYFREWIGEVQHWVHSGQPERIFKSIAYIGSGLASEYLE